MFSRSMNRNAGLQTVSTPISIALLVLVALSYVTKVLSRC